jgi:8-oxo-dGTP diphosphatase
VAAFIRRKDSVLLCRRSSGGSQGLWELPGGKLEPGETPREGLAREIREELSRSCEPGRLLYDGILPAGDKQYRFMVFEATLNADPVASNAHDLLSWVRSDELVDYELAPLDVPVLGALMKFDSPCLETRTNDQGFKDTVPGVQNAGAGKDFSV